MNQSAGVMIHSPFFPRY